MLNSSVVLTPTNPSLLSHGLASDSALLKIEDAIGQTEQIGAILHGNLDILLEVIDFEGHTEEKAIDIYLEVLQQVKQGEQTPEKGATAILTRWQLLV